MAIEFHNKSGDVVFKGKLKHKKWINLCAKEEGKKVGDINVIFCNDEELLEINRQYLQHDYYTDIITFDYSDEDKISGDLFISLDTVRSNGEEFGAGYTTELSRVIIHGVLHLLGYKDKSDNEVITIRSKEDHYLEMLKEIKL